MKRSLEELEGWGGKDRSPLGSLMQSYRMPHVRRHSESQGNTVRNEAKEIKGGIPLPPNDAPR